MEHNMNHQELPYAPLVERPRRSFKESSERPYKKGTHQKSPKKAMLAKLQKKEYSYTDQE